MTGLNGQAAIVAGNAEDLGHEIAAALVEEGARVAFIDDDREGLDRLAERLSGRGELLTIEADFTDAESTRIAAENALAQVGTPRTLVHNAARFAEVPVHELTFASWRAEVDIILQSAFILTKAVWGPMTAARSGSIVYVSSGSALNGFAHEAAYVMGKHAQEGLMKVLALEGMAFNVAVNTVTPGAPIDGPLAYTYDDATRSGMVKPATLAPAFAFAAGFEAAFATGQRLNAHQISEALQR